MTELDYNPKLLHVVLNLEDTEYIKMPSQENGLIYNPKLVFAKINDVSERMFFDFFKQDGIYQMVPIITEQGPGELVKNLEKRFGVESTELIGGIIAPFKATARQAKFMLKILTEQPKKYFESREKLIYG